MTSNSQCKRVLEYMKREGGITALEGFNKLRPCVINLSGRIFELKQMGHVIDYIWLKHPLTKVRYKEYQLVREAKKK